MKGLILQRMSEGNFYLLRSGDPDVIGGYHTTINENLSRLAKEAEEKENSGLKSTVEEMLNEFIYFEGDLSQDEIAELGNFPTSAFLKRLYEKYTSIETDFTSVEEMSM